MKLKTVFGIIIAIVITLHLKGIPIEGWHWIVLLFFAFGAGYEVGLDERGVGERYSKKEGDML